MTWFVEVLRTTLQNNVPVEVGNVLGRYSSPRFKLKSCTKVREEIRVDIGTNLLNVETGGSIHVCCTKSRILGLPLDA